MSNGLETSVFPVPYARVVTENLTCRDLVHAVSRRPLRIAMFIGSGCDAAHANRSRRAGQRLLHAAVLVTVDDEISAGRREHAREVFVVAQPADATLRALARRRMVDRDDPCLAREPVV